MAYRCIITGENAAGKSRCEIDAEVDESPGWMYHFWQSTSLSPLQAPPVDPSHVTHSLEPPHGGSVFRFFHIPPDGSLSREEIDALFKETREKIGIEGIAPSADGKIWHRTATLDYVVILQGNPLLLLDEDTVSLKPLDVVIQRGTYHAWSNPESEVAIAACVLISAEDKPLT
jgi:hypothetical protein